MKSIHGQSAFKRTSPQATDSIRQAPEQTLDSINSFDLFCPSVKDAKNARFAVLDNFKEISRIMTQNFLTHKKLQERYQKSSIPRTEAERMRVEEEAQMRMTNILKKMHSPANFSAPHSQNPGHGNSVHLKKNFLSSKRQLQSL